VDLINTKDNTFQTIPFENLISEKAYPDIDRVAIKDHEAMRMMNKPDRNNKEYRILTLDRLFDGNVFVSFFRKILELLEESYFYPVEIEFTVNFTGKDSFKINLLQCRPLQTRGLGSKVEIPESINKKDVLFESQGYFLGGNVSQEIHRVIYVDPGEYAALTLSDKHEVARIVGNLNRGIEDRDKTPVLLMGPGRWGTTTPSLGVPVKFSEINNIAVIAEVAFLAGNLNPELSFGTHFFQDLVEMNIFYVALFPEKKEVIFNEKWFKKEKNLLVKINPEAVKYKNVIGVYDVSEIVVRIMSDVVSRRVVCFAARKRIP
jgi:hypothetical protein